MAMRAEDMSGGYSRQDYGDDAGGYDDTYAEAQYPDSLDETLAAAAASGIQLPRPKPKLSEEEKFAKEVERRRQFEIERRHRIFDARRRNIGCDKEMLDFQCEEKARRKKQDAATEKRLDRESLRFDRSLKLMEIEKQRVRKDMEQDCKEYSIKHLGFKSRSTSDLNDPHYVRNGTPMRLGDFDTRCGPSSMQRFNGEDLMKEERMRQQKACIVDFIEQQKFEKSMIQWQTQNNTDNFNQEVAEITALRNDMEENEYRLRREMQRDMQTKNFEKADENTRNRLAQIDNEQAANAAEIEYNYTAPFLNENGRSLHNGRIIRDAFKGATRSDKEALRNEQLQQLAEKDAMRAAQKRQDMLEARQTELTRRQLIAMERAKQGNRRGMMEEMSSHNRNHDVAQKQNLKALNQLYTNEFSDKFWGQFGAGGR